MSGGHWGYIQQRLADVADDIDELIEKNGKPKTKEELDESCYGADWYEKYPEDLNHCKYEDEVLEQFKKAGDAIRIAQVYIQRVDWLLSGDDGEETFLERIDKDLNKLKNEKRNND